MDPISIGSNEEGSRQEEYIREFDKLIERMKAAYRINYPHFRKVVDNNALEFKIIMQLGALVFESKNRTYFVMPTNVLLEHLIPHEYEFKTMYYDIETNQFIEEFKGTETECGNKVIEWQEIAYGFNNKILKESMGELLSIQAAMEALSEYFSDEENNAYDAQIKMAQYEIRKELNLLEDDELEKTDTKDLVLESFKRKQRYENNRSVN